MGEVWARRDHDLIETILGLAYPPRRKVPRQTLQKLEEIGSLQDVISAPRHVLAKTGLAENAIDVIDIIDAVATRKLRYQKNPLVRGEELTSPNAIIDYLHDKLDNEPVEVLYVLYVTSKLRLIADEEHGRGTINRVSAYPRELVRRALEHDAGGIVLVHNHPSGDLEPSHADIQLTWKLHDICLGIGITLFDHLIVARDGVTSLRLSNLLEPPAPDNAPPMINKRVVKIQRQRQSPTLGGRHG